MLTIGDGYTREFVVTDDHTVPAILPDEETFKNYPEVFTTGCLLASMELACIEHLTSHLEQGQISLGVKMDLTHDAACTVGTVLIIESTVSDVSDRTVTWDVTVTTANDSVLMGRGKHTRAIVDRAKFTGSVNKQVAQLGGRELANS